MLNDVDYLAAYRQHCINLRVYRTFCPTHFGIKLFCWHLQEQIFLTLLKSRYVWNCYDRTSVTKCLSTSSVKAPVHSAWLWAQWSKRAPKMYCSAISYGLSMCCCLITFAWPNVNWANFANRESFSKQQLLQCHHNFCRQSPALLFSQGLVFWKLFFLQALLACPCLSPHPAVCVLPEACWTDHDSEFGTLGSKRLIEGARFFFLFFFTISCVSPTSHSTNFTQANISHG